MTLRNAIFASAAAGTPIGDRERSGGLPRGQLMRRALSLNLGKASTNLRISIAASSMAAGKPVPTSGPGTGVGTPFTVQVSNLVRATTSLPRQCNGSPVLGLPPNGWTGP